MAEVALPISFKVRNIEATERAASKIGDSINKTHSFAEGHVGMAAPIVSKGTNFRFTVPDHSQKSHPSFMDSVHQPAAVQPQQGVGVGSNNNNNNNPHSTGAGLKRSQQSSDDYALDKYKKVSDFCLL